MRLIGNLDVVKGIGSRVLGVPLVHFLGGDKQRRGEREAFDQGDDLLVRRVREDESLMDADDALSHLKTRLVTNASTVDSADEMAFAFLGVQIEAKLVIGRLLLLELSLLVRRRG